MSNGKWCPFRGITVGAILSGAISTKDEAIVDAIGRKAEAACLRDGCGVWNGRRCGLAESPVRRVSFMR